MNKPMKAFFLGAFGVSLAVSISGTEIAGWLLLAGWIYTLIRYKKWSTLKPSPLDIPFLCFAVWNFSIVLATRSTNAIDSLSYTSPFLLFYWAAHDLSKDDVRHLAYWYCWGAAVVGLWGVLQVFSGINYMPNEKHYLVPPAFENWPSSVIKYLAVRNERAVGPRSHPLTYAECLIPAVFIFAALAFDQTKRRWNPKAVAGGLLVAAGALLSQSRAVWIGLFVAVLAYILISKKWKLLMALTVLMAVSGPIIWMTSPALRNRVSSIFGSTTGRSGDQLSKNTRFELWKSALVIIQNEPWTGVGLKGAKFIGIDPVTRQLRTWTEAHNEVLQVAVENGLIGLGLYFWLWVMILISIGRLKPPYREMFGAIVLAYMVAGITESWGRDKEVAILFWVTMGIMENIRRHEEV